MSRTSAPNVSTASKSTLRDQIPDEAQLPPSEPKLHVLSSPDKKLVGQSIGLRVADAFLLGRGVDRDGLNVADPKMSRLHARIVWDGRSSMSRLDDAESANGCFVDGERRAST